MFRHHSANFRESTNTEEDKSNIPMQTLTRFHRHLNTYILGD